MFQTVRDHAMQSGRLVEAERIAGELLRKNPADARAAHIYGHSLYMQGRGHDAITVLERAARQNHSPVLDTQLGMLLRQTGRIDDSLKHFERAIKQATPFPPAFLEYGSLLIEMIRYDEAVDVLEHGLALAPDFAEILVHLGYAHAARGDRNKAIELFSRAISAASNDLETLFNLACLMKNACCFAQAAQLFKRMPSSAMKRRSPVSIRHLPCGREISMRSSIGEMR